MLEFTFMQHKIMNYINYFNFINEYLILKIIIYIINKIGNT